MTRPVWPNELRFSSREQRLLISFDNGDSFELPYADLRRESPSAEVQGHGSGPKPPLPLIPENLTIEKADPVGRYAVRLYFSDGHSSGLFTWGYLHQLGTRLSLA